MEDFGTAIARASTVRASIRAMRRPDPDIQVEDLWGTRIAWHAVPHQDVVEQLVFVVGWNHFRQVVSHTVSAALHGNAAMANVGLNAGTLYQLPRGSWQPSSLSAVRSYPTFRELSHETVRAHVRNALAHLRAEDLVGVLRGDSPPASKTFSDFVPSQLLINLVREGVRTYSQGYAGIVVDPNFAIIGPDLFSDKDLSEFLAVRIWRLMLTLADDAIVDGFKRVEVGDLNGFKDQIDLMILERIPVQPKSVTAFLKELYNEYQAYAFPTLDLPDRGILRFIDGRLWMELNPEEESEASPGGKAIVSFE